MRTSGLTSVKMFNMEVPLGKVPGVYKNGYMSHLLLLGKFEYGGGPIFKVVLEC